MDRDREQQQIDNYTRKFTELGFTRMDLELITRQEYDIIHEGGRYIEPKTDIAGILQVVNNKSGRNILKGNNGISNKYYGGYLFENRFRDHFGPDYSTSLYFCLKLK